MNQHGTPGEKGTGNDLGEVMVYAFLEDVLGAPKIFTKAEIVGGTPGSRTDGVHLLKLNDGGNDKYQLVLAASDITGNIKNAVDSVIQRLDDIAGVTGNERRMVDRAILSSSFDADTTSYLKSILIPSRAASGRPDISFGIFIGYSLGIDPSQYDNDTYRSKAMEKMKQDVEDIAPYISAQLSNASIVSNSNITNHSFYFYFMPFDDADNDKDKIMQDLLSGGAGNGQYNNTLGQAIYDDLEDNTYLKEIYENILYNYGARVFNDQGNDNVIEMPVDIDDALRFADLLSNSTHPTKGDTHKIMAQEMVALLQEMHPEDARIAYYLSGVLSNIENYRGLSLAKNKEMVTKKLFMDRLCQQYDMDKMRIPADGDKQFFRSQAKVYEHLSDQYFSYSGPTSMGKSFIMRMFIKQQILKRKERITLL